MKKKFSSIEKKTNIKIKLDNYNYITLKVKILIVKFSKIVKKHIKDICSTKTINYIKVSRNGHFKKIIQHN